MDHTDLASVRQAFRFAAACPFQQAWLTANEVRFSPGAVRVGWRENSLLVFAELMDADIFNGATGHHQPLWELGDVFEMFFKSVDQESYVEFQVAPNNQRLQLHYPDARAVEWLRQQRSLDEVLVRTEAFDSRTWVEKDRWHIYAEIPAHVICGAATPIEDTQWQFSFGRYDYTRGVAEPVMSSTSPHAKADFHRQHEWGVLTFDDSPTIFNR